MRAFSGLRDAISEEIIDKLPPVMNIRDLQAVAGTSASYLRSSLTAGRLTGTQVGSQWKLPRDENRPFLKRRILKQMNDKAKPADVAEISHARTARNQPAAATEPVCVACGHHALKA
ncbi:hypothetical protein GCM10022381_06090 [Leifsonia kafniensis]|uniref:DNA-binding protein n=1 Tax=Leifsonia kafniensis TaxID=475957 RepID=A0ABP7K681_9MICO